LREHNLSHQARITGWIFAVGFWVSVVVPIGETAAAEPSGRQIQAFERGALVIAGGGPLPGSIIERVLDLGGGEDARLVFITTASSLADSPQMELQKMVWTQRPHQSFTVLNARTREEAQSESFVEPLRQATAVWFVGGNQNILTDRYLGTKTETELHRVLQRGGVIAGTSAGAAIMSRVMIGGGRTDPLLTTGFGFLPQTIVDQHFLRRNRQVRLTTALQRHPGHVGIGIDEETAAVITPGKLEVVGNSDVLVHVLAAEGRPELKRQLQPGDTLELDQWQVAAAGRARWDAYRQAEQPPSPNVRQGSVVITGAAPPPRAVDRFLAAAGGKDAPVVIVSAGQSDAHQELLTARLRDAGAANVRVLQADDRIQLAEHDLRELFAEVRGVWLAGGQPRAVWNIMAGSALRDAMDDVLNRGGAVAGSSAGAFVHGDGAVGAMTDSDADSSMSELNDETYEHGVGLLTGLVLERLAEGLANSQPPGERLHQKFPNAIGVGLRDSTAVLVQGTTLEVLGDDAVHVTVRSTGNSDHRVQEELVQVGERYDLQQRRRLQLADSTDSSDMETR
jgi:cyanophycinase